jgi:hypothetical protein
VHDLPRSVRLSSSFALPWAYVIVPDLSPQVSTLPALS